MANEMTSETKKSKTSSVKELLLYILLLVSLCVIIAMVVLLVIYTRPPDKIGTPCVTTSECSTAQICHRGICMASLKTKCTKNSDCVGNAVCNDMSVCELPVGTEVVPTQKKRTERRRLSLSKPNKNDVTIRSETTTCLSNVSETYIEVDKVEPVNLISRKEVENKLIHENDESEDISDKTIKGNLIRMYLNVDDGMFDTKFSPCDNFIGSPLVDITTDACNSRTNKYFTLCQINGNVTNYILDGIKDSVKDFTLRNGQLMILFENGNMKLKKEDKYTLITSDIQMDEITNFNNFVYGNSDGIIYSLTQIKNGKAEWVQEDKFPENIVGWSKSGDGKYFWLQDVNNGYLFDMRLKLVDNVRTNLTRIYGEDKNTYIEIDKERNNAVLSENNIIIYDIVDGAFTENGLTKITSEQYKNGTLLVKNLDDNIYYISSKLYD